MKKNELIIVLLIAIAAVFLLKGLRDTLKNALAGIGIGTSTDEDADNSQIEKETKKSNDVTSPWNPNYWSNPPKGKVAKLLKVADADRINKEIYDSIGLVYDSPEETLGALKQVQYKTQISWLVKRWAEKGHGDLYSWLNNKLDTKGQREIFLQIVSYVKQLPTGFIKSK